MSVNYIDVKVTVWNRLHFKDEADMKAIAEIVAKDGVYDAIDDEYGFFESETLYDTEEKITVEENGQQPTIEVYANTEMIWDNVNQHQRS